MSHFPLSTFHFPLRANRGGFTLIELLVVISIIGLLASIILVALNGAKQKGQDARIVEETNQLRNQFEIDRTTAGVYPDLGQNGIISNPNSNVTTLTSDINSQANSANAVKVYTNGSPVTAYAIYSKTSVGYYCVDSTGQTYTDTAGGSVQSQTSVTCPGNSGGGSGPSKPVAPGLGQSCNGGVSGVTVSYNGSGQVQLYNLYFSVNDISFSPYGSKPTNNFSGVPNGVYYFYATVVVNGVTSAQSGVLTTYYCSL